MSKWLLWLLGAAYAVCPYDLLPDFLLGPGWIDDILLLGAIWWYVSSLRKKRAWQSRGAEGAGSYGPGGASARDSGSDRASETSRRQQEGAPSPYEVLGVERNAGQDEIRSAYRRLAAQYHPDKLSHLGQEFQALAEKRFKEIQEAYETLKASGPGQPPHK
ncbi:DnaJ domain protein [uncultured Desulfatiglans sp.]|nr:DnaJ domain protein [uncultured Desulfatiglans sp.]